MKMEFDRRQFIAGSAGMVSMSLLPRSLLAAAAAIPPAPVARVEVVNDTYFGETLSDPYRWMENSKDPDWLPFLKAQNDHTRAIIDALPGSGGAAQAHRATLRRNGGNEPRAARRRPDFLSSSAPWARIISSFSCAPPGAPRAGCWWTPRHSAAARATCRSIGGVPRPTASTWCTDLSKDGSEDSLLHILKVADGKDLARNHSQYRRRQPAMAR